MNKYTIYSYTVNTTPINDNPILDKSPSSKIEKADSLEEPQKQQNITKIDLLE
jgi:hypothetical protein